MVCREFPCIPSVPFMKGTHLSIQYYDRIVLERARKLSAHLLEVFHGVCWSARPLLLRSDSDDVTDLKFRVNLDLHVQLIVKSLDYQCMGRAADIFNGSAYHIEQHQYASKYKFKTYKYDQ